MAQTLTQLFGASATSSGTNWTNTTITISASDFVTLLKVSNTSEAVSPAKLLYGLVLMPVVDPGNDETLQVTNPTAQPTKAFVNRNSVSQIRQNRVLQFHFDDNSDTSDVDNMI